jgi:hypothetical protein
MKVRGLDSQGDFLFGKGLNDYKVETDAISQILKTRLQMFLGDCFFAIDQGIDWFGILGTKRQTELKLAIASTILNTPEVTKVVEVSTTLGENRILGVQYKVETIYGPLTDSVQGV